MVVALLLLATATAFALDPPARNMVGWQDGDTWMKFTRGEGACIRQGIPPGDACCQHGVDGLASAPFSQTPLASCSQDSRASVPHDTLAKTEPTPVFFEIQPDRKSSEELT